MAVPHPSEKALRDLRRRLGPAPIKALFEVVAGPLAQPRTPGVCFAGLRTVAFDGLNSLKVPDTDRNRSWVGRIHYRMGWAGYPTLRLMTLAETGSRGLLGAVLGTARDRDETSLARRLLALLRPGMLVLLDPGLRQERIPRRDRRHRPAPAGTRQVRPQPASRPAVADGSYLSRLNGLTVRIIEAELTMSGADGSRVRDSYRLITTLHDHRRCPAGVLVRLYHERWEIESAYLAVRINCSGSVSLSKYPIAPSRNAALTWSVATKVVSMATSGGSGWARSWPSTVRPSLSGMRMSSSTTSGRARVICSLALAPSHATTTSMSGAVLRISDSPERTNASSSTRATRYIPPHRSDVLTSL